MAGKQNNSGVFMLNDKIAYTDEMLATVFRRPLNTVRLALDVFQRFGMIEIIEGAITIPNWEKHQSLDGLEAVRAKTRKRVAAYREKQKLIAGGNGYSNVTVTPCNATDKDIEEDIDIEVEKKEKEKKASSRFTPPSIEEVRAYCQERKNYVNPEHFIDYYTSNGWKVGKNAMKDWKAAVRTWEKRDNEKPAQKSKSDYSEYADLC